MYMEKIFFEKEICDYLQLPSIPKKEWDGNESFKNGVAIVKLSIGGLAYSVCTFDKDKDKEPRIKKSFAQSPFVSIEKVLVVPAYMNTEDIQQADLDEQSKKAAEILANEAKELTETTEETNEYESLPEWIFPEITNQEQAEAWLRAYNSRNAIRGKIPTNAETIKLRLLNIYSESKKH